MSILRSSTSDQDGLLALVDTNHPPSQQMRPRDDDESLIMCSLAKSRPACGRSSGCDSTSPQEATRLGITSAVLEPSAADEEESDDDDAEEQQADEEDDDDEEVAAEEEDEDEDLRMISSPVIDVIEQIDQIPYDEITESFRKDINQMMSYDTMVNSLAAQTRSESAATIHQRPSAPGTSPRSGTSRRILGTSKVPGSPLGYASTTVSRVTEKDMERLREFVRMDRGLPLTKKEKRKRVEYKKEPAVRPKMNRATAIRTQHIRKCSLTWSSKSTSHYSDASIRSREEELVKRAKKLAAHRRMMDSSDQPLYKYNKVFEMRYLANKGNPVMPTSFRDSYEAYNKPLFTMARKISLPKRYLWPEQRKNQISYLGFSIDERDVAPPPQYREKKVVKLKKTLKLARPPVRKAQRVVRMKPTPRPKSKRTPWNYGVFERAAKRLVH